MLKPEYLMSIADPVIELFSKVEIELTTDIARRIMRVSKETDVSKWQVTKGREFGHLTTETQKTFRKANAVCTRDVKELMTEASSTALQTDDAIYTAAGLNPVPVSESPAMQAIILQGTDDTMMLVNNFTKTTAIAASSSFTSILDTAYLQIITGQSDYVSAIRRAINELASQGITSLAYASGSHISIEAGIRRAVLTGINQSVAKLQLARAEELGCRLVETTSHAGARPSHAEWQGMVFCIKGHHPHYGDFYRETGYGSGEGLCGWNCYHSFYPFFEGLSTHSFQRDPSASAGRDNDEDYNLQQRQRYLERMIREAKRRCEVIDTARNGCNDPELREGLDRDFQNASVLLKQREERLSRFIQSTGRTRLRDRESIGGWNRSISGKAVWANRKAH